MKDKIDPAKTLPDPTVPDYPKRLPPPPGLRQKLLELGPEKFAAWVRKQKRLLLTDTTMRDAHQSLLATRFRSFDMLQVADCVAHLLPELFSLEMWGGATFDTSMRFLQECPWERLAQLRKKIPNIPFQMLLRASNAVGYTNYPDNVVREFIRTSAAEGIDIFRIFDSLNWIENMKVAMQTVREETSSICEAAICYTGDMLDPQRSKFNLDYYLKMARELEALGAHIIAIKDMAGLCKPPAAYELIKALRQEVGVPIHFHTHDTSGVNAASILRAADAGVDIADAALSSMSGMTSQPCLNSVVAALMHTRARNRACRWTVSIDSVTTGRTCARTTIPLKKTSSLPAAKSISTRCPAGSSPTCDSRPPASACATVGGKSVRPTPPPIRCSATS